MVDNLNKMYSVSNYRKSCSNYAIRNEIVPGKKKELLMFLSRLLAFHGSVFGPIYTSATYFTDKIGIISDDDALVRQVETRLRNMNTFNVFVEAWVNLFIFPQTCMIYFPAQTIEVFCKCGQTTTISPATYQSTLKIVALESTQSKNYRIRTDGRIPEQIARNYPAEYGLEYTCPHCASLVVSPVTATWNKGATGSLNILNPVLYNVETNDVGLQRIEIDPANYDGYLKLGQELEPFHLMNVPWDLAVTYAAKDRVYVPDTRMYKLLYLRKLSTLGTNGGSMPPAMSSLSDLITSDLLKMGMEAMSLSKIDPLYVASPLQATNIAYDGANHAEFKEFFMQGIKAHQEGDINRLLYSPLGLSIEPIFGDGKRYISIPEIMSLQNSILGQMGMAHDGTGFTGNPVLYEAMNKTVRNVNDIFIDFMNFILSYSSDAYYRSSGGYNPAIQLWMPGLSQINNGISVQERLAMVDRGELPTTVKTDILGLPSLKVWRSQNLKELVEQKEFDIKLGKVMTEISNRALNQAEENATQGGGANMKLAKEELMRQGEEIMTELSEMDNGAKQSYIKQLKVKDYPVYAVVSKLLEDERRMQNTAAKAEQSQIE